MYMYMCILVLACRCRFSQMLKPVIEETARAAKEEFKEQGQVVVAALDCEKEGEET